MLELDLFILEEMMAAPEHPLGKNMERPLPNFQHLPQEEIRAIQQRDRIPGVTRYDLWVSRLLDLTIPPWQSIPYCRSVMSF